MVLVYFQFVLFIYIVTEKHSIRKKNGMLHRARLTFEFGVRERHRIALQS